MVLNLINNWKTPIVLEKNNTGNQRRSQYEANRGTRLGKILTNFAVLILKTQKTLQIAFPRDLSSKFLGEGGGACPRTPLATPACLGWPFGLATALGVRFVLLEKYPDEEKAK